MAETTGSIEFCMDDEVFQTGYKIFGELEPGTCPLLALHGGPGMPHSYILPIAELTASKGIPVIFYDQLGCGMSTHLPSKPKDFWTVELFMAELDNIISHLGIADAFDLYGQSWGGMLAANYVVSRNPKGLRRLIISDSPASIELWTAANNVLLSAFSHEFREMLRKHELGGTTDSLAYQQGIQQFNEKHICTVSPWPDVLIEAFAAVDADPTVYSTMIGPSEFNITGTLKTWSIVDDLHKISAPTLLISGKYNQAQDIAILPFFQKIGKVKWVQFAQSSHTPIFEEKKRYLEVVADFLADC
ncbi:proline-specific peptidase [Mycena rosella]|uniref:Proline-specific peptidase n=1 Tax=Mycena rosella TaxID=1033263 RepID=A0AAD7G268_MYCRO|nr:proline-specific peptidase [Mycena rosella]